jgi:hypothetical protein
MGDFNDDGKMDWVVSNGWDDNLWLYLGNGDGTSATPTILPLKGTSPDWVAVADLRKMGRADIVIAENESSTVGVLFSNGDGTFQAEQELTTYNSPDYVTVADLNGDGSPDIIAGGGGCAAVLLGDGKGNFQAPLTSCSENIDLSGGYPPPTFTTFISFADFNKDGKLDMLISVPTDGVMMLLGDGQGNFTSPVRIVSGSTISNDPYFFLTSTTIDYNGDGCPDAAIGDWQGMIFLFAGDCAGNFKHPASLNFGAGDVPAQLSVADINGDGHPDLVASGLPIVVGAAPAGRMLSVMLSDGQGSFQHAQVYRGGDSLVSFAAGDLNGDGNLDVLAVAQNENGLYEFLNEGSGGFGAPQGRAQFSIHGGNNQETDPINVGADYSPLLADVNADGLKDLVYIDYGALESTYSAAVSLNLGSQGFADPVFTPITTDNSDVVSDALGDFHGTGQLDLLVATDPVQPGGPGGNGSVYLMQNLGGGKYGTPNPVFSRSNYATSMYAVDLNGDGKQDLLIFDEPDGTNPALEVLLGNGNGTFSAPVSYPLPSAGNSANIFSGDFNGDKKTDILLDLQENVLPFTSNVIELLGNGNGTLQTPQVIVGNKGLPPFDLFDLNHDGLLDILAQDWTTLTPSITTYFGLANGNFGSPASYKSYSGSNGFSYDGGVLAGDFNHDGNIDVAAPQNEGNPDGPYNSWVQFYSGNPDGTLTATNDLFDQGEFGAPWLIADIDGSGTSSAVEFDANTTSFDVMKGAPAPPFQIFLDQEAIVGNSLSGLIILNQASSSDTGVSLKVSDPAAIVPATVTIPAGSESQTFTLQIQKGFSVGKALTVTATLGAFSTNVYAFSQAIISPTTVKAPNLAFGLQPINTSSSPLTVTVVNNTLNAITLINIVFDPSAAYGYPTPDYTESDNCHTTISAGSSCAFNVVFTPTIGNQQESTELDFQDPMSGQVYKIVFTGTGEQPIGLLTPSTLSFGSQAVGTVSTPQTLYLTNNGTGTLLVSGIGISGPFQVSGNCDSVPAPESCRLQITFAPTSTGPQAGGLTLAVDGAVPTLTAAFSGAGVALPNLAISPASLIFPPQLAGTISQSQIVTLANPATVPVPISQISITGSFAFAQTSNCGSQVAAGQSCQIDVIFTPVDGASAQASLNIAETVSGSQQQVMLSGQGLAFTLAATPASATVSSGSSATYSIAVSESTAYPSSLALSCTGLPVYAQCAFSPATVSLSNTTPVSTSLTVTTGSSVATGNTDHSLWRGAAAALATLVLPFFLPRKRRYGLRIFLIYLAGTTIAATLISCGGGGVSTKNPPPHQTPAGTYTFTVVASRSAGGSSQQSMTLVVQ